MSRLNELAHPKKVGALCDGNKAVEFYWKIIMSKELLTPYLELDATLRGHAEVLKEVLRGNFTGFYLIGSLAIGDFDLTSDIDFIVVTDRQLSDTEVKEVQKGAHKYL